MKPSQPPAPPPTPRPPSPPPLELLHASADWLVLHKPAGLLVHRTGLDAHNTDTVMDRARLQWGGTLAPVHRLDRGTSGVLVLARHTAAASDLGALFREGRVDKHYLGVVRGWPTDEQGCIDHPLARDPERPSQGQPHAPAQTHWRCLQRLSLPLQVPGSAFADARVALLELQPLQGRRHQLRRHCKHLGHPLLGDSTHGKGPLNRAVAAHLGVQRLWLHAKRLGFVLEGVRWEFEAPPGPAWEQAWEQPRDSHKGAD